jgi:microcystin-dependent protein
MEPFIGQIQAFAFEFAPRGWAPCDGRVLPIQQYAALFSLLGTTYGGNGVHTFALPDLRGRVAVGNGNGDGLSSRQLGEQVGSEAVNLTVAQLPAHTHEFKVSADSTVNAPKGNYPGPLVSTSGDTVKGYDPTPEASFSTAAIAATGGSQPHNNLPPYLAINWCIALQGIFPSRN